MDLQEYPGSMPACFEKGLPRCPVKAVIPTMTMETTDGIKKLQNTVVHVIQNNATYYVDDKHRITEICSDPVERNNYDFEENPENFRGQLVFDYDNQRGVYYNNRGEIFNLVVDGLSFDSLTNRPKYNGSEMTHATNIPLVPTQLSQLENDSGFITESVVTDDIAAHNVDPTAHADIRQAITDEATARATADNTLDGKITAEETARIAADNALATADSVLDDKITAEATARATADNTLDSKITTETTDRATADATLQSNINAEATARANADTSLGNRITSEETTRSAADSALAGDISAEVTRAEAAETALGGRIDDEATTRAAADTTLDGKITAEATARANADSTLDGKITDEATARANADTALGTRITDETTARTNADTAINNKLNHNVLYDLEMQTDANNVTFVEDKVNLGTGATTTERDVIPAASPTTAGTISASEYVSLVDAEEKITALLEGAVAIDNLPANPTQQQLTNAWLAATGKTELINRASIYDSANQLVHTYYTNVSEWEDSPAGGQITIDQFTNSAAGIIKGSTTDGNVSANLDGTGTVSGWTALKNTVAGKANSSDLATVATSGSYNDLSNKPTIPTVNNATLTIQKNGTTVKTFTANASTNVTANLTVPTKTSDITNDSNYVSDANYVHTDNNFTTTLKNKLDGIAAGAEVNQNAFSNVKVGSTTVAADSKTDTLELVAGSNVTLTPDATNDKVTIAATDTNTTYTFANGTNGFTVTPSGGSAQTVTVTPSIANATTSTAGLMSAADKTELDKESRVDRRLIADGTAIPSSVDLNTITYLSVGRYICPLDATAATLTNCPSTRAFVMEVFNSLGPELDNETTASWQHRIRRITEYRGAQWIQHADSASTAGTFAYSAWEKIATTSEIPTVNNATLTIQKNGTNVQTFTANSSTNKTANITVPTKVTDLTDGANYVAKDGDFYVTGEGSNFSMTGTSQNVYADLKVKGDTQQTTYTGKNLANTSGVINTWQTTTTVTANADGGYTITGTRTADSSAGVAYFTTGWVDYVAGETYRISFTRTAGTITRICLLKYTTTDVSVYDAGAVTSFSYTPSSSERMKIGFYISGNTGDILTVTNIQVEKGSTQTAFEPYVGGVPAPNPDYPQEVEVVTGRQTVKSCGKNLLDLPYHKNTWSGASVITEGDTVTFMPSQNKRMGLEYVSETMPIKISSGTTISWSTTFIEGAEWTQGSFTTLLGLNYEDGTTENLNVGDILHTDYTTVHKTSKTLDKNVVSVYVFGVAYNIQGLNKPVKFGMQLEKAALSTTYEAYTGKEMPVWLNAGINYWQNFQTGFLPQSGEYPTTTPTYPNACYVLIPLKAGQTIETKILNGQLLLPNGRIRYIDKTTNQVVGSITATTNEYFSSTVSFSDGFRSGKITAIKDFIAGVMTLNSLDYTHGEFKVEPVNFDGIELCKIGVYQDYIYPSGGKWWLHKETASIDWGTLTWTMTTGTIYGTTGCTGIKYAPNNTTVIPSYAEKYIGRQGSGLSNYTNYYAIDTNKVNVRKGSATAPNPTGMFYYPLATPIDTEITNPLLVAQLDDLWRNLQSGTNITNVNVEGDLPAILGVTAFTNTLASAMAGINERMNRLPAIPQITMTTTDPGEGQTLADNHYIAVYE